MKKLIFILIPVLAVLIVALAFIPKISEKNIEELTLENISVFKMKSEILTSDANYSKEYYPEEEKVSLFDGEEVIADIRIEGYSKKDMGNIKTHYCIPSGENMDCYMVLNFSAKQPISPIEDVRYFREDETEKLGEYYAEYWESVDWEETIEEINLSSCVFNKDTQMLEKCSIQNTTVKMNGKWTEINGSMKFVGERKIRIRLDINEGETLDVVPKIAGVWMDDWAWYTGYNQFRGYSTGADNGEVIGYTGQYLRQLGTNFTSNSTGTVKVINIYLRKIGTLYSPLEVYIVNRSGTTISLAWNVSNGTYIANDIPTSDTWIQVNMSDGPLKIDAQYFIGMMMKNSSDAQYLFIRTDNDGATSSGQLRWFQSTSGSGSFSLVSGLRAVLIEIWGTLEESPPEPSPCDYISGNWYVECLNACNVTVPMTVDGNITLNGSGNGKTYFRINSTLHFNSSGQYIFVPKVTNQDSCTILIEPGGEVS